MLKMLGLTLLLVMIAVSAAEAQPPDGRPRVSDWCGDLGGVLQPPEDWGAPDGRQWLCDLDIGRPALAAGSIGCTTKESPTRAQYADCGDGITAAPGPVAERAVTVTAAPEPPNEPSPEDREQRDNELGR